MDPFIKELAVVINSHGKDNDAGVPDFIIASMVDNFIAAFVYAQQENKKWHETKLEAQDFEDETGFHT